jgi:hypothetical protein
VSRAWIPKLCRRTNSLIEDLRAYSGRPQPIGVSLQLVSTRSRQTADPCHYAIAIVKNAPATLPRP